MDELLVESKQSILVVDGAGAEMSFLRGMLKDRYDLLFAATGHGALEAARHKKPDAVLLDTVMPDMSGFDVLAELKESGDTHDIPVILIMHGDNPEAEEKGFFLGAADYVTKPLRAVTVNARVKTQLEIVRQIRRVERYALIDFLVDLPNRRSFDAQMETEWGRATREKTPINLLKVDVDDFRQYNGTHGKQQGDIALQAVARALKSTLKRRTDMAFRLSGDKFAVILQDTTLGGALRVAEDIRANVEAATGPRSVTVSVGIASATPETGSLMSEFSAAADNALDCAKEGGKNTARAFTVLT